MDSIVNTSGWRKCIVVKSEREYRMVKGDLGTQLKREPIHIWLHKKHKPPVRKHGDIQGFSENSRSRLRVLLSTAKWNGGKCRRYGLTLTLPWAANPKEWRVVWSRFMKRLSMKHSNVAVIWRIELTTGKAERSGGLRRCHVHAMVWLPVDCVLSKEDVALLKIGNVDVVAYSNLQTICNEWIAAWQSFNPSLDEKQMRYACSIGESKGNGIVTKRLDDSKDGAIHYLCDHASKHKQEQLGWNGRQWGVINRSCFSFPSESDGEKVSGEDWAIASRQLRRLNVAKRRAGDKWSQPYGDNKCHFGKAESNLHHVLDAVRSGKIGRVGKNKLCGNDMKVKIEFGRKAMMAQITLPSGALGEIWQGSISWLWERFNSEYGSMSGASLAVYDGPLGDDESLVADWHV